MQVTRVWKANAPEAALPLLGSQGWASWERAPDAQLLARWFQLQNHAVNQKRAWGSQEGLCHLVVKRTGKYLVRNPSTVFSKLAAFSPPSPWLISAAAFHCCSWCAMQGWSSTFSLTFGLCGIFSFFNNPIYFATRDFPTSLYAIILDTKNIGQIFVQSP